MYDCGRVLVVHPFVHFCVCPFSHLKVVPRLLSTVQCCLCLRELLLESVNVGVLASRRLHGMLAQMLALLQLLQRPLQPLHLDILQQVKRVCMSVRVSRGARHGCPKEKKKTHLLIKFLLIAKHLLKGRANHLTKALARIRVGMPEILEPR